MKCLYHISQSSESIRLSNTRTLELAILSSFFLLQLQFSLLARQSSGELRCSAAALMVLGVHVIGITGTVSFALYRAIIHKMYARYD